MNLQRMLERVTSHLAKEADTTLNTVVDRTEAINESVRAINLKLRLNRKRVTVMIVSGQATLPSDLLELERVYVDANREISRIGYNDLLIQTASTLPSDYYYYDAATRNFITHPAGSTSMLAEYLANYAPLVNQSDLAYDGNHLPLHPVTTLLAANMLYRDRGPEQMATSRFWLAEFEREVKEYEKVWREQEDVPERLVMGYSYPQVPRRRLP